VLTDGLSGEIGEGNDADQSASIVDHGKTANSRATHGAFNSRQGVPWAACQQPLGHCIGYMHVAQRLSQEQSRHADISIRDHAHDSIDAVARAYGQTRAIPLPHEVGGSIECVFGIA
jgi:hypothetical protein